METAIRGMTDQELTGRIIGCVVRVHTVLGPGFLESVYRNAMLVELRSQNLRTEVEKIVVVYYAGEVVGRHRIDLVVEDRAILEIKTVECLNRAHYAQVRSYMQATGLELALLVNFATARADFRRVESPRPH